MTGTTFEDLSVSGYKFVYMAQRFPDALAYFGFTLESLGATQSAFYEHFFTEEEQAIKQRDAALASIGQWNKDAGLSGDQAITTSEKFRTYVEALKLTDTASQDAYLRAMQAVPAFIALDEALAAVEGAADGATDALMSVEEFLDSIRPDKITNSNALGEMIQLFNSWGMQIPSSADALYALTQAGVFTDAQMRQLASSASSLGYALQEVSDRQNAAVGLAEIARDNAIDKAQQLSDARIESIRAAYDAQMNSSSSSTGSADALNDQLSKLNEALSLFKSVVDSATKAIRSLTEQTDAIDETRQRYLFEGSQAILQYSNTGSLPENVTETISGLSSVDPNDFASKADWLYAVAENQTVLQQLLDLSAAEVTDTERQIALLEKQVKAIESSRDSITRSAQTNMDRAIAAEQAALNNVIASINGQFDTAKTKIMSDTNLILDTGNGLLLGILDAIREGGSLPGYNEAYYLSQNPDVERAVDRGDYNSGLDHYLKYGAEESRVASGTSIFNEASYLAANPDVAKSLSDGLWDFTSGLDHYQRHGMSEGRGGAEWIDFDEDFYLSKNKDVVQAIAAGYFASGLEHFLKNGMWEGRLASGATSTLSGTNTRFPMFADGGIHTGGLRIVGERGPELEYTGPSSITPNHGISGLFREGNAELHEEMRALREEVKALRQVNSSQAATNAELLKIHKRWNGEGLPPDRMDYQKTTAEAV